MANKKNVIANRYEVISHIGQGGMADVFLAIDTILNRQVAIKILRSDMSTDAVSILRFEREAQAAAALAHPNIVEIYDVGDYKGHHYIVMEYVTGQTLKQVIRKRAPLMNEEAVDIMKQLCSAIAEAHSRGIIHRDIKPQNVIVRADGSVKILDFGIATAKGAMQLTQANNVMGSVHYLAPELARGDQASPQSDIYALGICLFEMLTGDVPFKADQAVQIALKQMREDMPSVREKNPNVPQALENVVIRATAKDPAQRYRSCDEMLMDVSTCLYPKRANEKKLVLKKSENHQEKPHQAKVQKPAEKEHVRREVQEPVRKKKPKKSVTGLLVAILAVVTCIALVFTLFMSGILSMGPKHVEVPDVTGMALNDAQDSLTQQGLAVDENISYQLTTDTDKGTVISTDPQAGAETEEGTNVTLTVSSGIGVTVDNYVGQNISDVKEDLSQYPLLTINAVEQQSDKEPGTIIDQQQLSAGSLFDPSMAAQITRVYAAYPSITIPEDIMGKPVNEAKSELEALGIEVRTSNRDTTQMSQKELDEIQNQIGLVIDCSPAAGTSYVQKGSNFVTLYFY